MLQNATVPQNAIVSQSATVQQYTTVPQNATECHSATKCHSATIFVEQIWKFGGAAVFIGNYLFMTTCAFDHNSLHMVSIVSYRIIGR